MAVAVQALQILDLRTLHKKRNKRDLILVINVIWFSVLSIMHGYYWCLNPHYCNSFVRLFLLYLLCILFLCNIHVILNVTCF